MGDYTQTRPHRHTAIGIQRSSSPHVANQHKNTTKTTRFERVCVKLPDIDRSTLPLIKQNLAIVDAARKSKASEQQQNVSENSSKERRRKITAHDVSLDDIKRLVLRLHRHDTSITDPELMTEIEKRIYLFLKKSMPTNDEPPAMTDVEIIEDPVEMWRRRRGRTQSRVWTDDAYTKLNQLGKSVQKFVGV